MNLFVHLISAFGVLLLLVQLIREQKERKLYHRIIRSTLLENQSDFVVITMRIVLKSIEKLAGCDVVIEGRATRLVPCYPFELFRFLASLKPRLVEYTEQRPGYLKVWTQEPIDPNEGEYGFLGKRIKVEIVTQSKELT